MKGSVEHLFIARLEFKGPGSGLSGVSNSRENLDTEESSGVPALARGGISGLWLFRVQPAGEYARQRVVIINKRASLHKLSGD